MDGSKIKELRLERGWNQSHLAVYSGLGQSVVSEIERGQRNPSSRTLTKLAKAFEVTVPELFVEEESPKAPAPPSDTGGGAYLVRSLTSRIEETADRWWGYLTDPPAPRATYGEMYARWLEIRPQADSLDAEVSRLELVLDEAAEKDREALREVHARLTEARDAYYGEMLARHELEQRRDRQSEPQEASESR